MANTPVRLNPSTALVNRRAEVSEASWNDGMNFSGNTSGVGIADDNPGVDPNKWTLLDQFGAARQPQNSGNIGHTAWVNRSSTLFGTPWPSSGGASGAPNNVLEGVDMTTSGNGQVQSSIGDAFLITLETGWFFDEGG